MALALFITFEGGEGSGKSTQARALYRRLLGLNIAVLLTHEPGGTPLGRSLRRWLKDKGHMDASTELLLFNASRAHLISEVMRPALDLGTVVICDRFAESTVAYQGYGRRLDLGLVHAVNNAATQGLKPDLIVFLDIPVERGLARKGPRDRFEREDIAFHERVRAGYLEMAAADPQRWLVVDGCLAKKQIQRIVWDGVERLLNLR
jgi:dTMP kinase